MTKESKYDKDSPGSENNLVYMIFKTSGQSGLLEELTKAVLDHSNLTMQIYNIIDNKIYSDKESNKEYSNRRLIADVRTCIENSIERDKNERCKLDENVRKALMAHRDLKRACIKILRMLK